MSEWKKERSPKEVGYGSGWCNDFDRCWREGRQYVVMSRQLKTEQGIVGHVCVRNVDNSDIPWIEKQRIKNELFGSDRTAIEVFPSQERLIDDAGMYHFWVLPKEFELPFGLHESEYRPEQKVERGF